MSRWNPTWAETKEMWKPAFQNLGKFGWNVATTPAKVAGGGISYLWNRPIKGVESSYYPSGEASLKELYSAEGMRKGGEWQRKFVSGRVGGWLGGITGTGASKAPTGSEDESTWQKFKNILDASGELIDAGTERVEDPLGGWSLQEYIDAQLSKLPSPKDIIPEEGLVQIPDIDLTPMKEGMDNFAMALAMGLGSLGQGIGGGLPQMPQMPSMQLVGEEGEPNILLLGGLAAVAYVVLKGRGK